MARQGEGAQGHSTKPTDNIFGLTEQQHIQVCHERHVRHFRKGHKRERLCSNCRYGYPGSPCPTWAGGNGKAQPKRKRRSPRRLRTGNSTISVIDRDARGNAVGQRAIFQGNDTKANRLWASMLEASGVLTMPIVARQG